MKAFSTLLLGTLLIAGLAGCDKIKEARHESIQRDIRRAEQSHIPVTAFIDAAQWAEYKDRFDIEEEVDSSEANMLMITQTYTPRDMDSLGGLAVMSLPFLAYSNTVMVAADKNSALTKIGVGIGVEMGAKEAFEEFRKEGYTVEEKPQMVASFKTAKFAYLNLEGERRGYYFFGEGQKAYKTIMLLMLDPIEPADFLARVKKHLDE
jgi:hypothetical protein